MLVRTDLSDSIPLFIGADQLDTTTDDVTAGVVHFGIPFDDAWNLSVDGTTVEARRAFGETTAYDVVAPGVGSLRYDTSALRWLAVAMQTLLWLAAIVIAARVRVSVGRRDSLLLADETLIDLTGDAVPSLVDPGFAGGSSTLHDHTVEHSHDESGGVESGGVESGGVESGGVESGGVESGDDSGEDARPGGDSGPGTGSEVTP